MHYVYRNLVACQLAATFMRFVTVKMSHSFLKLHSICVSVVKQCLVTKPLVNNKQIYSLNSKCTKLKVQENENKPR